MLVCRWHSFTALQMPLGGRTCRASAANPERDKNMHRYLFLLSLLSAFALAEDLHVTEKLAQQVGVPLDAYIGGQIFKIIRTSPLPNIFGKSDIFGRTVDRGSVELRYQGQTADGKLLVFRLVDIDTRSNETTMNRTPVSVTSGQATAKSFGGTTTARGTAYTIRGQESRNEMLPPNTTEFAVDPERKRDLRFVGVSIKIVEFDETSMRYSLASDAKE
jgi:hypothetical protein